MAAILKYIADEDSISQVPIKAAEIKAATHQEIITVGNDVFQKNNQRQQEVFNAKLREHELDLIKQLEEEKNAALEELRKEHEENIEKLKQRYAVMQEDALKEEAVRLRDIMDKIATTTLEKQKLEGQKKLDEYLKQARTDFDVQKSEALIRITLEHQKRQNEIERLNEAVHKETVEKLNVEWEEKMKIQAEEDLLHENETLENQLDETHKKFDSMLQKALSECEARHIEDITDLNEDIESEKNKNINLKNKIQSLHATMNDMKTDLKEIVSAFQSFVDQSPGFSPGQSEFILSNILPGGFNEFISSSQ